jgi:uncharacterized NAD(P)/FAD-binding protein YdhS
MPPHITIIGSGFSGTLTAIHLLSQTTTPLTISLIDPRGTFGPGLAYSPPSKTFTLNVKAKAMGALPSDGEGFFRWLKKKRPSTSPNEFAPRSYYGEYLCELLNLVETSSRIHTVNRVSQEVIDLERTPNNVFSVTLSDGSILYADACVLALGNIPRCSLGKTLDMSAFHPPYSAESYSHITGAKEALIIGSSLTAVDVILESERNGFRGEYTVISRHGRFPLPHEESSAEHQFQIASESLTLGSVTKLCAFMRSESRRLLSSQPVFDHIRPHIQTVWKHLPEKEKQRFLRHLQPIWDIHRHRIPVQHHETLQQLQRTKRLRLTAGRFHDAKKTNAGCTATYTSRGARSETITKFFDVAFLCVGPEGDLTKMKSPLIRNLLRRGLITPGTLRLGIVHSAPKLAVVGPLQRELLWEITAVRELREEAQLQAAAILQSLGASLAG